MPKAYTPASERTDLIAEEALAKRLGISPTALHLWSTQAHCTALGGKKLYAHHEKGERYYRLSDAERIEAVPLLGTGGILDERGELLLSAEEAMRRLGYWRCRPYAKNFGLAWLGHNIRPRRILVREHSSRNGTLYSRFRRVAFYPLGDIEKIEAGRAAGRSRPEDPWPSFAEARAQGYSEDKLKQWRREGKVQTRPGNRLVKVTGGGEQWNRVTEYCPGDLKMARATEDAARQGKPEHVPASAAVAPPFCFTHSTLARWRHQGCPYLPGHRRLPYHQDEATGHSCYLRADLETILRSRVSQPGDPHIDPDSSVWLPTSVVEREHGLLEQTLNELRQRRERSRTRKGPGGRPLRPLWIRSKVIPRPGKKIPGGRLRVWNKDDVLHYVAWRNGQVAGCAKPMPGVARDNGTVPDSPLSDIRAYPVYILQPAGVPVPVTVCSCPPAGQPAPVLPTSAMPLPVVEGQPPLNDTQQSIVECVRQHGPIMGEALARKLSFPYNSHFRQTLSGLVQRGSLKNIPREGYTV